MERGGRVIDPKQRWQRSMDNLKSGINYLDKSVHYQRSFIQRIIDRCGPRIPGSEEEKMGAGMVADEFMSVAGNVAVEEFQFAPKSCIAAIPGVGIGFMIAGVIFYIHPLAALVLGCGLFVFSVPQIILYREWFDVFFPKSVSRNIYSILDPPGGEKYVKATLVLSGHIDSSWHCTHFADKSQLARFKLYLGVASAITLLPLSLFRYLGTEYRAILSWPMKWTMLVVPFLFIGFYYLFRYMVYDKKKASPGAMDNLSGIATALNLVKYYRSNRKRAPRHLRILLAGFGAEEAGLRGSRAFVRRHQDDLLAGKVWVLNFDGVADKDDFLCIEGEAFQMVRYDRVYVDMVERAMREMGLRYHRWVLDAGGTDAAEFAKAGIKNSITLSAQSRMPNSNYHTSADTLERMDPEAMRLMNALGVRLVAEIDAMAGAGPATSLFASTVR
jgi:aminopeptidase YwaD